MFNTADQFIALEREFLKAVSFKIEVDGRTFVASCKGSCLVSYGPRVLTADRWTFMAKATADAPAFFATGYLPHDTQDEAIRKALRLHLSGKTLKQLHPVVIPVWEGR